MKKTIQISLIASFFMSSLTALAGSGGNCHFHGDKPANEATISTCANQKKMAFIKNGKIVSNWQSIGIDKIGVADGKRGKEWRVVFSNPNSPDKENKNLFMFFTQSGNFIAANFTGQ